MRKIIFAIIFLAFSVGVSDLVLSHGDEKHDANKEEETTPATDTTEQVDSISPFQLALDSNYLEIAASYKTIELILKKSCYDCHSSKTVYPWYHSLPIVSGFLDAHIKEAREHIDFSDGFPFGGHASQIKQLEAIKKEIAEGEMPLWSYQIMHWNSAIEGATRDSLFEWLDTAHKIIVDTYQAHGMELGTSTP